VRLLGKDTLMLLEHALREDLGAGDVTTRRVVPGDLRGSARVVAREAGVLSAAEVAAWVFRRVDPELAVHAPLVEGARFEAGTVLLEVSGRVAPVLSAERLALNLLARLCGIATLTRAYVDAAAGTGAVILDTRKTTPGWRELERAAVRAGGGLNHRGGLDDAVLIKENHVRAAGGVAAAWRRATAQEGDGGVSGGGGKPRFLEIEVRDLAELHEALDAGARMILLDNFTPADLARAVRVARDRAPDVVLEASGGVGLENVRSVAETGVDRISVGAITHSARALDLSLLLEQVERGPGSRDPVSRP
jgi:nicotinate-nucleotide pyrophosphorylase (carboxylating)